MKGNGIEQLKIYKIATIILIFTTIFTNGIGILTGGFTAWEKLSPNRKNKPIISMRIEPLVINYENAYDSRLNKLLYLEIETSGGTYKLKDEITLDSLKMTKPVFFEPSIGIPSIALKSIQIDKTILDQSHPNVSGFIKVDYDFILDARSIINMKIGDEQQIAYFDLNLPYEYDGRILNEKRRIPLIIKR